MSTSVQKLTRLADQLVRFGQISDSIDISHANGNIPMGHFNPEITITPVVGSDSWDNFNLSFDFGNGAVYTAENLSKFPSGPIILVGADEHLGSISYDISFPEKSLFFSHIDNQEIANFCAELIEQTFSASPYSVEHAYQATAGNGDAYGTSAAEVIYGDKGNNVIHGRGGDDILDGGAGNDTLYGDKGNDYLYGGLGHDTLYGGEGKDEIYGGNGNDKLYGGEGKDVIYGGNGNDKLYGDSGNDTLYGDNGSDYLNGGDGNDYLSGGDGNDKLYGGKGNDVLVGGYGDNVLYGETGDDVIVVMGKNDKVYGGDGNDTLVSYTDHNSTTKLHGGAGDDHIINGSGTQYIYGDEGNDSIAFGTGTDYIWGGKGKDTFDFSFLSTGENYVNDFTKNQDHISFSVFNGSHYYSGVEEGAAHGSTIGYTYDATTDTTNVHAIYQEDPQYDMHVTLKGHIILDSGDFIL